MKNIVNTESFRNFYKKTDLSAVESFYIYDSFGEEYKIDVVLFLLEDKINKNFVVRKNVTVDFLGDYSYEISDTFENGNHYYSSNSYLLLEKYEDHLTLTETDLLVIDNKVFGNSESRNFSDHEL